jgi:hypothetical protein
VSLPANHQEYTMKGKRRNVREVLSRLRNTETADPPGPAADTSETADVGITLEAGQPFDGETSKHILACNDWLRMGVTRSLSELIRIYRKRRRSGEIVPTTSLDALSMWNRKYNWNARANLYDRREDERNAEQARVVMSTGLALAFRRVEKLKELAAHLEESIYDDNRLWLSDWRMTGGFGKTSEFRKVYKFNVRLVEQYRAVLDDLAKETGGRIQRQELSGVNGTPIQISMGDIDGIRERIMYRFERLVVDRLGSGEVEEENPKIGPTDQKTLPAPQE